MSSSDDGEDVAMAKTPPPASPVMGEKEEEDEGAAAGCGKKALWWGGCCANILCLPFICCTCYPGRVTINEGQKGARLEYGKNRGILGPGTYWKTPMAEEYKVVNVRTLTADVPPQDALSKDNIPLTVNAVVYFSVFDVGKALFKVNDFQAATKNLAQTGLRTVIGENTFAGLSADREQINERLRILLDKETDDWGVRVSGVEIKDVKLPIEMQRMLASVAEAEHEGRARVITAESELKAAGTLAEAADIMSTNPVAIQLRYFSTLSEISKDPATTIVMPSDANSAFNSRTGAILGGTPGAALVGSSGGAGAGAGAGAPAVAGNIMASADPTEAYKVTLKMRQDIEREHWKRLERVEREAARHSKFVEEQAHKDLPPALEAGSKKGGRKANAAAAPIVEGSEADGSAPELPPQTAGSDSDSDSDSSSSSSSDN